MGVDYSGGVGIGYILTMGEVQKPFIKKVPEQSHMEERYDAKTGKKLKSVKVIDVEAGKVVSLSGHSFGSDEDVGDYEFTEILGETLNCRCEVGGYIGGYDDSMYVYFMPKCGEDNLGSMDAGRVYVGGSILFGKVLELKDELERISKAMKKLGLDSGKPRVFVAFNYG